MLSLQTILFGEWQPPPPELITTRQHKMLWNGKTRPAPYVEPVKRTYASATEDKVFACIKANPGLTITQITAETGIAKTGVRTMLSRLKNDMAIRLERGEKRPSGGGVQEGKWYAI